MKLNVLSVPRQAAVDRRMNEVPPRFRKLYGAAVTGKASPREAINAMCGQCLCWEGDDGQTLQDAIRCCTSLACPLWAYRPYQSRPTAL
jgi:hypothetical protein